MNRHMKRRSLLVSAFVVLVLAAAVPSPAHALEEADRLFLVGERAVADGLNALAARALERFVADYPNDGRIALATLLLGRAWLGVGLHERALQTFRKAQTLAAPPGPPSEARLWEAEALFRLKRYAEARTAFEEVFRNDPTSPLAADALYGLAWTEMEGKRHEVALKYFRELIATWPDHALVPSASVHAARALVELKRYADVHMLLIDFQTKYPTHPLRPDAQYLLGVARLRGGDPKGGAADLRAFVEANPKHELAPMARRLTDDSVARVGDRDELQAAYQARIAESPATPEGLHEAATIAGRLGRPKDQEAAWRKLRKEFPDHALARRAALDLGTAAFKRKEWKDAAVYGRAAGSSDEGDVRAEGLLLAGEAELKQKRFPEAVKAFEGVAATDGVDAAVRYRALAGLGLAHEEQQNLKPALAAYEAVAGKSPDAALREWAQERVKAVKGRLTKAPAPTKPAPTKPDTKAKGKS
jgi:TolA-binding protein